MHSWYLPSSPFLVQIIFKPEGMKQDATSSFLSLWETLTRKQGCMNCFPFREIFSSFFVFDS